MQLISLNIWGGHVYEPLIKFMQDHQEVDIFCLQEVYHDAQEMITKEDRSVTLDIFAKIQEVLPNHQGYFKPVVNNIYGIATFIHKKLLILSEGDICIYDNPDYSGIGPAHSRNMQWLTIQCKEAIFSLFNVHGLWNGQGKTDTPARLAQSVAIKSFMNTISTPKLLCGDFNLRPDTKSLDILRVDMRDLIDEYNVKSTRTVLYLKDEQFADYILVSSGVNVENFKILPDVVSDHAPLCLSFSV